MSRRDPNTHADASRDRYQYDRLNRVTNKVDAANVSTKYGYDANGNLLSMQAGSNPQITFTYDGLNRRTNMSDGVGTTRWTFDSMNRIKSESGPFGTTVVLGYDALSRMTSISFSGYTWSYHYDALGRVTNMVTPEGVYRLGYLAQGTRKASMVYPNGVTASMHYDSLIRMTNLAYSVGATNLLSIRYGYDNGDRRTSEVWGDGRSLTYAYDRAHQVLDSVSTSRASDNASYRYDKAGNPRRRSELGFIVSNGFNNLNQIMVGVWTGGAITVSGAVNFNAGTVTVNGVTANRFGLFYEKTNVSLSVGTNIITAVYRGPAFTNSAFIATARTEVVVGNSSYGHDANGNLTNDANFIYRYDAMNQLTNVVTMQGGTNLLANRYDGLGRRVQATTDGTNIVRYVYLPGTFLVLATLDATNGVKEVFTHGPDLSGRMGGAGGIGGILSQTKHQGQSTTHFLHTDSMGNVVLTTDASGLESSSYRYTPFGRLLGKSGSFASRFTYSSKEFDAKTGLGYWGYRFYNPQLGRWLNRDPIYERGGVNLYEFCGNRPTGLADHWGLQCAGFINGRACNPFTGQPLPQYPDAGGWPGASQDFCTWLAGAEGPTYYGPGTQEAVQLSQSAIARQLRNEFLRLNKSKDCKDWKNLGQIGLNWGPKEVVRDIFNGTAHFVGSGDGSVTITEINTHECGVSTKFRIINRTSLRSFLYHRWPERLNNDTPGTPACNWWQTYEWNEVFKCSNSSN